MEYKSVKVRPRTRLVPWRRTDDVRRAQTSEKRVLFDVGKDGAKVAPKWVEPEEEQEPNESRRCVLLSAFSTRD